MNGELVQLRFPKMMEVEWKGENMDAVEPIPIQELGEYGYASHCLKFVLRNCYEELAVIETDRQFQIDYFVNKHFTVDCWVYCTKIKVYLGFSTVVPVDRLHIKGIERG